jgi:hypothetical protein
MPASGTTTINFGAFPGASDVTLDVATAGVVASSKVEAWIQPVATADHSIDEHVVETIRAVGYYLSDGNIRIRAFNTSQLNEPLEAFRGGTLSGGLISPPQPQLPMRGGTGTRLYGVWTVGWAWA